MESITLNPPGICSTVHGGGNRLMVRDYKKRAPTEADAPQSCRLWQLLADDGHISVGLFARYVDVFANSRHGGFSCARRHINRAFFVGAANDDPSRR